MILLLIAIVIITGLIILYIWKKIDEESFEEKTSKDPAPYFLSVYYNFTKIIIIGYLACFWGNWTFFIYLLIMICSVYVIYFIYLQIISED